MNFLYKNYKALEKLRTKDLIAPEFFHVSEKLKDLIVSRKIFKLELLTGLYDFLIDDLSKRGCDISKNINSSHWENVNGKNILIENDSSVKSVYRFIQHLDCFEFIELILGIVFYAPDIVEEELILSQIRDEESDINHQTNVVVYKNTDNGSDIYMTCNVKIGESMLLREAIKKERYLKEVSSRRTICKQVYANEFYTNQPFRGKSKIEICVPDEENVNFVRLDISREIKFYCLFAQESDAKTRIFIKESLVNMLNYIESFFND